MSLSRILYLILIFICTWSAYYLYDKESSHTVQVAPNLELPMFSGKKLDNITYNPDGIRSHQIESTHLDHYAKSGDTIFENPILSVFRDGHTIEWQVTARRAVMSEDQELTLYDNVVVKNLLPDASFDTMTTDKFIIELVSRDFRSDTPVHMIGPQFETEGQAMKGNFDSNTATLFNNVQGRYETLTP
ncbi:LPS export ABC transporter periplasmic protein LptC [Vibrio sp. T187]|uniref:LPS export ABC transporter periplasmic protein LptC n=1 Tax=Vibrio TaxID=662 RepID=UPI0010C9C850|nr:MULTISPECIES: LPS export ABC transporter periplasmic protein LptC [Vibrio]MBW3697470.1 LPS export ABC transporter periplasmic protein LptC [Vibrio sp. T187]